MSGRHDTFVHMARLARIVIPDVAHRVTQRGNRRLPWNYGAGCKNPQIVISTSFRVYAPVTVIRRADMLALERQMVIANPGPLNNEPWAVKARGGN